MNKRELIHDINYMLQVLMMRISRSDFTCSTFDGKLKSEYFRHIKEMSKDYGVYWSKSVMGCCTLPQIENEIRIEALTTFKAKIENGELDSLLEL